eukprot:4024825-Prymnesium_polylepis.1
MPGLSPSRSCSTCDIRLSAESAALCASSFTTARNCASFDAQAIQHASCRVLQLTARVVLFGAH